MNLAEGITTLRRTNGLGARPLAALVDVAPTTATRVEFGAVSPSFDLAPEMLAVPGEQIGFAGTADATAITAARLALDSTPTIAETDSVRLWWARWSRIGLVDESGALAPGQEADLLPRTGRSARLTRRPGAVRFAAGPSAHRIAETLADAGPANALTGDAGANLYRSSAAEVWPVRYAKSTARYSRGSFSSRVKSAPNESPVRASATFWIREHAVVDEVRETIRIRLLLE